MPPEEQDPLPSPPDPSDPRLQIPEVLRTPVRKPDLEPVFGDKKERAEASEMSSMGRAWAMAMDFVFSILAGAGVGYLIDYWRNSLPIGTCVGLGLGFVTAFIRIIRATQRQEREEKARRGR